MPLLQTHTHTQYKACFAIHCIFVLNRFVASEHKASVISVSWQSVSVQHKQSFLFVYTLG